MNEPEPQLIVRHVDDLEWHEVRAQQIGDRRTSVWTRFVDITEDRTGFDDLLAEKGSVELPQPPFTLPPLRSRGHATAG